MQFEYHCADCDFAFGIWISQREWKTTLSGCRDDACPRCGQRVGYGRVHCGKCHNSFVVRKPLWHKSNDLAFGKCPTCCGVHLQPAQWETAH